MLYRAGNIEIDTVNFHLSDNGDPIAVEPQVFDLIVYLITNRDRLVTRLEIFDNLWSGRIVSDTSLSNHIKSARKVLGDDGQKQQVIKTHHGRGYQFVANTKEVDGKTENPENSATDPRRDADKSIAVLAFADLSPEQNQEYFSDGITDELIILLAKIPELRVISRTSSFSFKGKNATTEEIAKQLNVTHILEGSVRKSANQLRINTQLIQVSDESNLWSETYNREMKNIFDVQDDIAQAVIRQLKITLLDDMTKTTIVNPDAYTLYLEAKYLHQQYTSESFQKAEKVINESISIDPHYAPAWDLLSGILESSTDYYAFKLPEVEARREQSNRAVQKAIELDPEYAPAYSSLALIHIGKWDFKAADYNIKKAMSLDNANSSIINNASVAAMWSGRIDEAMALLSQAAKLDPVKVSIPWNLGLLHLWLNQPDEAINAFNRVKLLLLDGEMMHCIMALILIHQGKLTEAMKEVDKEPLEYGRLHAKSAILFAQGNKQEADRVMTKIIDKYGATHPSYVAYLYAFREENDFAFEWLEKAFELDDQSLIEQINYPAFRNLKDPRWCVFLKKIGLPKDHWLIIKSKVSG